MLELRCWTVPALNGFAMLEGRWKEKKEIVEVQVVGL